MLMVNLACMERRLPIISKKQYAIKRFRGDCSFDLFKSFYDAGVVWSGNVQESL